MEGRDVRLLTRLHINHDIDDAIWKDYYRQIFNRIPIFLGQLQEQAGYAYYDIV